MPIIQVDHLTKEYRLGASRASSRPGSTRLPAPLYRNLVDFVTRRRSVRIGG